MKKNYKLIIACLLWVASLINIILTIRSSINNGFNVYRFSEIIESVGLFLLGYSLAATGKEKLMLIGGIVCLASKVISFIGFLNLLNLGAVSIDYAFSYLGFGYFFETFILISLSYILIIVSIFTPKGKILTIFAGIFALTFAVWNRIDECSIACFLMFVLIGVAFILMYTLPTIANDEKQQPNLVNKKVDIDALASLSNLKNQGIITEEEFDNKKKELLGYPIAETSKDDTTEKLAKLKELYDKKILSDEEYQAKKAEALNGLI